LVNWDGVSKLGNRPKGDHVTHLWSWIKTYHMEFSLKVFICRQYDEKVAYDLSVVCNGWK
jgi:hypothetical protein